MAAAAAAGPMAHGLDWPQSIRLEGADTRLFFCSSGVQEPQTALSFAIAPPSGNVEVLPWTSNRAQDRGARVGGPGSPIPRLDRHCGQVTHSRASVEEAAPSFLPPLDALASSHQVLGTGQGAPVVLCRAIVRMEKPRLGGRVENPRPHNHRRGSRGESQAGFSGRGGGRLPRPHTTGAAPGAEAGGRATPPDGSPWGCGTGTASRRPPSARAGPRGASRKPERGAGSPGGGNTPAPTT